MNTRSHEGEPLQKALNVRVIAAIRLQQQTAGYARILFRKLASKLAKICEFAFVVFEQFFPHVSLHLVFAAGEFKDCVERNFFRRRIELHVSFNVETETPIRRV